MKAAKTLYAGLSGESTSPPVWYSTEKHQRNKASPSLDRVSPGTGGGAGWACQPGESSRRFASSSLPSLCVNHSEGHQVQLGKGESQSGLGLGGWCVQRKRICRKWQCIMLYPKASRLWGLTYYIRIHTQPSTYKVWWIKIKNKSWTRSGVHSQKGFIKEEGGKEMYFT